MPLRSWGTLDQWQVKDVGKDLGQLLATCLEHTPGDAIGASSLVAFNLLSADFTAEGESEGLVVWGGDSFDV